MPLSSLMRFLISQSISHILRYKPKLTRLFIYNHPQITKGRMLKYLGRAVPLDVDSPTALLLTLAKPVFACERAPECRPRIRHMSMPKKYREFFRLPSRDTERSKWLPRSSR